MAKSIQALPTCSTETSPSPALKNPAVAHCCEALQRASRDASLKGKSDYYTDKAGSEAYRKAMPPLDGYQAICDFIACVAHGMAIEAIQETTASKLLYAAQVALSTVPQGSKNKPPSAETLPRPPTPLPVSVPART